MNLFNHFLNFIIISKIHYHNGWQLFSVRTRSQAHNHSGYSVAWVVRMYADAVNVRLGSKQHIFCSVSYGMKLWISIF